VIFFRRRACSLPPLRAAPREGRLLLLLGGAAKGGAC